MDWSICPWRSILASIGLAVLALFVAGIGCASKDRKLAGHRHKQSKQSNSKGSKEVRSKTTTKATQTTTTDRTAGAHSAETIKNADDDTKTAQPIHPIILETAHEEEQLRTAREQIFAPDVSHSICGSIVQIYLDESTLRRVSSLEMDNDTSIMVRSQAIRGYDSRVF